MSNGKKQNAGDGNAGRWNAGHCNAGDGNAGNRNAGHGNAGDWNAGHWNAGDWNAGDGNAGRWNAGHWNVGDGNAGRWNAGHCNAGDGNAGDCNAGDWNAGDWNAGDGNAGYFCTETPSPTFFDKPTTLGWDEAALLVPHVDLPVQSEWVDTENMTDEQKSDHPSHTITGGYLRSRPMPIREAFPIAWAKMDDKTRQRFLDLPNFNAAKFLAITGVDVREVKPQVTIRMADGRTFTGELVEGGGS